jgi:hypothetical protein
MKCKIDGCDRDAAYKAVELCQKHYFRQRRYGTTDLSRKPAKPFYMHRTGYVLVRAPGHPLAMKNGNILEHRKVVYERYGEYLPPCEICGAASSWATSHIDHKDRNRTNNAPTNLRPLCPGCNTWRDMPPLHTFADNSALTFDGKTDTAQGWARDPRVKVAGRTIILRKQAGMSDADALFSDKVTHNGKVKPTYIPKTQHLHERKNAIRITVDGVTKTAAEWARDPRCQIKMAGLAYRIKAGWDHKRAVFESHKDAMK